MRLGSELVWLDLESENPTDGVRGALFVLRGRAPALTEWVLRPWVDDQIPLESRRRIVTFNIVVRRNVPLIMFLREKEREDAARYAAIPSRVRKPSR